MKKRRTVAEAIEDMDRFGVSVKDEALRRWIRARRVPALRLPNGEYRLRVEVIDAIIHGTDPHEADRLAEEAEKTEGMAA